MSFENDRVELETYLLSNGFDILASAQNFVRYGNDVFSIRISRNPRSRILFPLIQKGKDEEYELTPEVADALGDARFKNQPSLTFSNLLCFFEGVGNGIILGEEECYLRIVVFHQKRIERFHRELRNDTLIDMARSAWKSRSYNDFVDVYNKLEDGQKTEILYKQYRIAMKKINAAQ